MLPRFLHLCILFTVAVGLSSCSDRNDLEGVDWDAPFSTPVPTRRPTALPFLLVQPEPTPPPPRKIAPPVPREPIVLFDGSDTTGFASLNGFTLEDGILKGQGRLHSAKPFSNYEIEFEFRYTSAYTWIELNRIQFHPVAGAEAQKQAVGSWLTVRAQYRAMPGEQARLHIPGLAFTQTEGKAKKFADQNLKDPNELPRDANGFISGEPMLSFHFRKPVEIRRLALRALDPESPREYLEWEGKEQEAFLAKGKKVYTTYCVNCHGDGKGAAPSPVNRSLGLDAMQNGSDPLSLYRTLTQGYRNMIAMPQLTPEERHQVASYLSEVLFQNHNPAQYKPLDRETIDGLPQPLYLAQEEFDRRNKPEDQIKKEQGTYRDLGPLVVGPFGTPFRNAANVLLDSDTAMSYDLYGMNVINVRTDGFLDMLSSHHFQQRPSTVTLPTGTPIPALNTWFWRSGPSLEAPGPELRQVPEGHAYAFKGYYLHERRPILSYEVKGRSILEMPSLQRKNDQRILLQQLRIGAGPEPLQLALATGLSAAPGKGPDSLQVIPGNGGAFSLQVLGGEAGGLSYSLEDGFLLLNIPGSDAAREFTVLRAAGSLTNKRTASLAPASSLEAKITGSTRRWPSTYTMAGSVSPDNAAYVMDTLPVPYENEYKAWMRTTALAFFPDGRAVVTTHGGDVWMVSGIDRELKAVTWSRFAAGLYQAFGVKVVDGRIHVVTRNGIVRLHDLNEDGEADYYEQFFADPQVSSNWHGYNFDLIHDPEGYFLYAKSGQFTDIQMEGGALRISPDGKRYEEYATGFRTPNGMGLLADGRITYGENQGGWVPAGKIAILQKGSWHGGAVRTSPVDREPAPPLICFPQDVDNSCGGQLWLDDERFGPYANMLMHTSCGHARAMMIFLDEFDGISQAATQSFPFHFDSGVMRLDTNPSDGQVYLTGTRGWQINAPKDGNLQRIRYTGKAEALLMGVQARKGGILLRFNEAIDPASLKPGNFQVSAWNYKRAKSYGSKDYKPSAPDTVGRDNWPVSSVEILDDARSLWMALPDIMLAHQVRVGYQVGFASGTSLKNTIHLTINGLRER